MKYLLDTNIVINHLRGKQQINYKLIPEGLAVSLITFGELLYGVYISGRENSNMEQLNNFIRDFEVAKLTMDEETMHEFGKIKSKLKMSGNTIGDFDLLIAATAKSKSLTLLTGNVRHFKRIGGLKLIK